MALQLLSHCVDCIYRKRFFQFLAMSNKSLRNIRPDNLSQSRHQNLIRGSLFPCFFVPLFLLCVRDVLALCWGRVGCCVSGNLWVLIFLIIAKGYDVLAVCWRGVDHLCSLKSFECSSCDLMTDPNLIGNVPTTRANRSARHVNCVAFNVVCCFFPNGIV